MDHNDLKPRFAFAAMKTEIDILYILVLVLVLAFLFACVQIRSLKQLAIVQASNTHALVETVGAMQKNAEAQHAALINRN